MNEPKLTAVQRKAVETAGKNICVSAGAGTGKTNVLVERFLYLIEQDLARVQEILAITFTEKAAQEMKARIAMRLRERGREEARRELENACIGTIHSFCARVLREHPIEAGVDPQFRVLEENEANLLKEVVLDELIEARFQEPAVFDLLRAYSEDGIRNAIRHAADRVHTFGASLSVISSPQEVAPLVSPGALPRGEIERNVLQALEPLKQLKGKEEDCASVEEVLQKTVSNWEELEALKEIGKRFKKQGKEKTQIETFRNLFDEWILLAAESLSQGVRETFLNFASDFATRYQALKGARSGLDFNDLERKAVCLLSGESPQAAACRNWYREHFKFVMVDEFQDTSPVQDRLINFVSRPDNLFIVGDWKQSIYGFRGADASLFLKREKAFSPSGAGERIPMVENFRSSSELLDFINPFFKDLWANEGLTFEALTPHLPPPAKAGGGKEEGVKNTSVEFITVGREEGESIQEARMKEARALAEKIRDLVQSGAYEYKDFAMLFRVATDIFFYEYELRNLRIPYYVVSGRGFYRQPEIRDVITFLELLENPHLDIPLAGVLRSPLVQVSDDTLFWLAAGSQRPNSSTPLYHAFLRSKEISEIREEDQARLESFRSLFLELLREKEKWTISECIETILARTQYDRYVLGLPQGKRHFANLRKLIEMAREVESREPIHLGDFIRYVKGLETQEVRESEAQVEALEGDVVKLMTVHKAKGLEFKVVILPDLNRKGEKHTAQFLVAPEYGLGVRVFNEATQEFEDTFSYRKIKERMIQNARAESKRLLYVGMTRACDHLILSGASKAKSEASAGDGFDEGANWYEWVDQWFSSQAGRFKRTIAPPPDLRMVRHPSPLAEHKKIRSALEENKPIEVKASEDANEIIKSLAPITPVYFERIDLPVTAYSIFERDPEEYRRAYELGALPEESFRRHDVKYEEWMADEDETALGAAEFGTAIHRVFEHLVSQPESAGARLSRLSVRFSSHLDQEMREEVLALSQQFLKSDQFAEIRHSKTRHAEIPFVLRLKGGIIQGTLDLLYQTADGNWVILDYKTSQLNGDSLEQVASRYRTQLMLYALACHELLKIRVARASLYFVRQNRSFDFSLEGVDFEKLRAEFEDAQKDIIMRRQEWHRMKS